jgi:hypothetical protein
MLENNLPLPAYVVRRRTTYVLEKRQTNIAQLALQPKQ